MNSQEIKFPYSIRSSKITYVWIFVVCLVVLVGIIYLSIFSGQRLPYASDIFTEVLVMLSVIAVFVISFLSFGVYLNRPRIILYTDHIKYKESLFYKFKKIYFYNIEVVTKAPGYDRPYTSGAPTESLLVDLKDKKRVEITLLNTNEEDKEIVSRVISDNNTKLKEFDWNKEVEQTWGVGIGNNTLPRPMIIYRKRLTKEQKRSQLIIGIVTIIVVFIYILMQK